MNFHCHIISTIQCENLEGTYEPIRYVRDYFLYTENSKYGLQRKNLSEQSQMLVGLEQFHNLLKIHLSLAYGASQKRGYHPSNTLNLLSGGGDLILRTL